jgi:hypothetical protein
MKPKDFTIKRDSHGDLMLVCPKGHWQTASSGTSLADLLKAAGLELTEKHKQ